HGTRQGDRRVGGRGGGLGFVERGHGRLAASWRDAPYAARATLTLPLTVESTSSMRCSPSVGAPLASSSERTRPLTVERSRCAATPFATPTDTPPETVRART